MESTIKTRFTHWWEFDFEKALEFAVHCRIIIEHIDRKPKKSCLFLLGVQGVLVVPYDSQK